MKTLPLLLFISATTWGQIDSLEYLDEKLERGEITSQEWYDLKLKSGYFSDNSCGWEQFTDQVDINSDLYKSLKSKSGLILHVPDNYQIIHANGNRYIQAYLFNLTDRVISISRIGATIDSVQSFFFINDTWKKVKENSRSSCGNSYWTQKLEPNFYISIQIENGDISRGQIMVKQKIKLTIHGHTLESREVTAMLNDNQLKTLKHGN